MICFLYIAITVQTAQDHMDHKSNTIKYIIKSMLFSRFLSHPVMN